MSLRSGALKQKMENIMRSSPRLRSLQEARRRHFFPNESLRVGLECPVGNEVTAENLEIRGWAVSLDANPVRGAVTVNGKRFAAIELNQRRDDVAEAFFLNSDQAMVGFRHSLSWGELGEDRSSADIGLEFYGTKETMVLGPFTLYRPFHHAKQNFVFRLESPVNDEILSRPLEIRGWADSHDGLPVCGRVDVSDILSFPLNFDQVRQDVDAALDRPWESNPAGFLHRIEWEELGRDVREVEVTVELIHGNSLTALGPIKVSRIDAPLLRHQRGSYKEVWESAASDSVSAMATVAGTGDWEDLLFSGRSTARTIDAAIGVESSDVVLEIGCGVGRVGYFLAPKCRKWIGADISGNMLNYARENLAEQANVELLELSSCSLAGVADSSVDKLYCTTVFMHLDEWDRYRYVTEAFRVLRPGGKCYFDNVNLNGEIGWMIFEDIAALDATKRSPAVSKPSTGEELCTYLERAGFAEIRVQPTPHFVSAAGTKPAA